MGFQTCAVKLKLGGRLRREAAGMMPLAGKPGPLWGESKPSERLMQRLFPGRCSISMGVENLAIPHPPALARAWHK